MVAFVNRSYTYRIQDELEPTSNHHEYTGYHEHPDVYIFLPTEEMS